MSPMLSSLKSFYLLAAGFLLFPLPVLGLSAWYGDFHVVGGGSWTPNSPSATMLKLPYQAESTGSRDNSIGDIGVRLLSPSPLSQF
jgi:hypothetical protein